MSLASSKAIEAQYFAEKLTIGAGVAIFHVQTERVVLCYHTREKHWFLPKGRKNANESVERTAEREGYEESGYRNRLLPLPFKHRQTDPDTGHEQFTTEAICTQLLPLSTSKQYLLFWFIAETLPWSLEEAYANTPKYVQPQPYPPAQTLQERCAEEFAIEGNVRRCYEPVRHQGTGVDEDELCYMSFLMPVQRACHKLHGTTMEDVIRRGWEAIRLRQQMEQVSATSS